MSKSYDLEEDELRQNFNDGYIGKEEYDRLLRELKSSRKDTKRKKEIVDEQED